MDNEEYLPHFYPFSNGESSSDSAASTSTTNHPPTSHKRPAGRKKFKETRHPIYRGVRQRDSGKWVCEVREPNKKSRIWVGTYPMPEMAARAYDVAAISLRGNLATLNFPDSAWLAPKAKSTSPKDIRLAALQATKACSTTSSSSSSLFVDKIEKEKGLEESRKMFIDEEAIFNMPGLLDGMAEGMLLTPLGLKKGVSNYWNEYDENDSGDNSIADLDLWRY